MWQYTDYNELYHHGVLGMRWGHRKQREPSTPRQYTRRLNKLDQKRATASYRAERLDKRIKRRNKVEDKAFNKALAYAKKGRTLSAARIRDNLLIYGEKTIKLEVKSQAFHDKAQSYQKTVDHLVNKAKSKGYTVQSKEVKRTAATYGQLYTAGLVGGIPLMAVATAKSTRPGTKYKVKRPKTVKR